MDCEFPTSDDEYDLIHQSEADFLKELKDGIARNSQAKENVNVSNCQPVSSRITEEKCTESISKLNHQANTSKNFDFQSSNNGALKEDVVVEREKTEQQRKRTYDELFGDIEDLLGTDGLLDIQEPKEKKPRWNQPDDIIEKILHARQLLNFNDTSSSVSKQSFQDKNKDSISLRVPSWNFIAVTRPHDSQRIYVRVRKEKAHKIELKHISNLLSLPYSQVKQQAQEIIAKNVERASSVATEKAPREAVQDQLWVEKYRPRTYVELLSDENVNREFLHWLKLWDKVVFNRNPIPHKKRKQIAPMDNQNYAKEKEFEEVDRKGIPVHRIVLLSGPPGLGKTTLAHVVANHAGYNVVEINASDDRGPDAFRHALLASTQMRAVMGANPRPNCLILDEIDGAPAPSIGVLLKFIQGKLFESGRRNKDKSEKQSNTLRPVVCICNEPYTPSLRPLRAVALLITVPNVTPARLADRLMEIARKEKLHVDRDVVLTLAKRSGCDVRSCLGGLQYMGGSALGENPSLGMKNTRKGLFDAWREILTLPMEKTVPVAMSERVENVLNLVHTEETEKLAQGIFHNYPESCSNALPNVSLSLEWFQYFDNVLSLVTSQQSWSLMPYTNHAFVAWHLYLSKGQTGKLTFPTAFGEANQKLARSNSILKAIQQSYGRDVITLATDFAPLMIEILTPRIRTVTGDLLSSKEKSDLANFIKILLDFGLGFVQEKTNDGTYDFKLDPNIFEVGIFPDIKNRRSLTYSVKQIVAQELETERLRRSSNVAGIKKNTAEANNVEEKRSSDVNEKTSSTVPNHLRKLDGNTAVPKDVVYKDFFGRIITPDKQQHQQKQNNIESQKISPQRRLPRDENLFARVKEILNNKNVWFKYKEGYSNAVRRTVLMENLL